MPEMAYLLRFAAGRCRFRPVAGRADDVARRRGKRRGRRRKIRGLAAPVPLVVTTEMTLPVELRPATRDTLPVVRNLFVAFFYDLSAYDPNLVINEYGLPTWAPSGLPGPRTLDECAAFNWWIRDRCSPYLILAGDQIAGFLHVCADREHLPPDVDFELMDFYIAPPFRRQGVGWQAARLIFDAYRGNWRVFELAKNGPALAFWHRRIADYTNDNFQNIDNGTQQRFNNAP